MSRIRGPMLAMTLLAGCFGSAKAPEHFYCTFPTPKRLRSGGPRVKVEEFETAPAYDHLRIVYRISPYRLGHYTVREWATKPGRLVSAAMAAYLEAKGMATLVQPDQEGTAEYLLRGRVEAIEEQDFGPRRRTWYAHLDLRLWLVRSSDGQVVWQARFERLAAARKRNLEAVVEALTKLVWQAAEEAGRALRRVAAPR